MLQTHDEASGLRSFGPAVEMIGAEIMIELTANEHVVGDGKDRGGECADCLSGAAAGAQAMELRLEIAGFFAGSGGSALDECGVPTDYAIRT